MLTIEDYLARRNWHSTRDFPSYIQGCCPIPGHVDTHPSFCVYRANYHLQGKEHFKCFSSTCGYSGDVVKLIWLIEFGGTGSPEKPAFDRYEELNGAPFTPLKRIGQVRTPMEQPLATREQQEFLSFLSVYWHKELWYYDLCRALPYVLKRGITRPVQPMGYIPSREESKYVRALFTDLHKQFGKSWSDLGISTGLLRKDGSLRLSHRLVFSAYGPDGLVTSYQARVLPDSPVGEPKFLNQPHLRKNFYHVPVEDPIIPGTVLSESPFGPSIISLHRLYGAASLGEGFHFEDLARFPQPFWICTDNDEAGEKQAHAIAVNCDKQHWEHYRIRPEKVLKGLDEWVNTRGIEPLLYEMRRSTLSEVA